MLRASIRLLAATSLLQLGSGCRSEDGASTSDDGSSEMKERSLSPKEDATNPASQLPGSPAPGASAAAEDAAAGTESESVEARLSASLREACQAAQRQKRPLLIEFSADWCGDCRRLEEMKKEPPLTAAWQQTPHFRVDVGHFDAHDALREAFGVKAIAAWHFVEASKCDTPASSWPRLAARTLEPRSGQAVTPSELAEWLTRPR